MENFRKACKKIATVLEYVIGIALAICLFLGGLGFVGYVVAFCIGGDTATEICTWIYKEFYRVLIQVSTYTTLLCFLLLYVRGDANWVNPIRYWGDKIREKKAAKAVAAQAAAAPAEDDGSDEPVSQ